MKYYWFITLLFFSRLACAQVIDNFADGDFTHDPVWSGSVGQFIINGTGQLQLSASVAGTSYLSTPWPSTKLDNFEWKAYVRQSFSSSGSNFGRVYLVSNQADLTQPLNGHFRFHFYCWKES